MPELRRKKEKMVFFGFFYLAGLFFLFDPFFFPASPVLELMASKDEKFAWVKCVNVTVFVDVQSVDIWVEARFLNDSQDCLEAVFALHEEESCSPYHFQVQVDGRVMMGSRIEDSMQALAQFDDAISAGSSAFLLQREAGAVFCISCGNVGPGAECVVKFRYLKLMERSGELRLPYTCVEIPSLLCTIHTSSYANATCTSGHALVQGNAQWQLEGNEKHEELVVSFAPLQHDDEDDEPRVRVERNESSTVVEVSLWAPSQQHASDIVFMLDRSGSMRGDKMESSLLALQVLLRSLSPGQRFGIVSFGSNYEHLFDEGIVSYDEHSFQHACDAVAKMEANMGGTELLQPLQDVLGDEEVALQIIILTDGCVSNTADVIAQVSSARNCRVFTLGIGDGADEELVSQLALRGNGTYEMVSSVDEIAPSVARLMERVLQSVIPPMLVYWEPTLPMVQRTPCKPRAFFGGRGVAYCLLDSATATGKHQATILLHGGEKRVVTVDLDGAVRQGSILHRLAIGSSLNEDFRVGDVTRNVLCDLALRHSVVTTVTSMIAISGDDDDVVAESAKLMPRNPLVMVAGRIKVAPKKKKSIPSSSNNNNNTITINGRSYPVRAVSRSKTGKHGSAKTLVSYVDETGKRCDVIMSDRDTLSGRPISVAPVAPPHHSIVSLLQRFDGTWLLDERLAKVLAIPLQSLCDAQPSCAVNAEEWATALAVAALELRFASSKVEWQFLAAKGASKSSTQLRALANSLLVKRLI